MGIHRFGEFELDAGLFQLRRHGRPVDVPPKALDLLLYLAERRERVVGKEELIGALWPEVVVSDASLAKAVSSARRALGDDARTPRWIETVRGRGFRFTAPLTAAGRVTPSGAIASRAPRSGFVGRAELLSEIVEAAEAGAAGRARLVLLAGEAGMGKTRTAVEAIERLPALRAHVGWCAEHELAPELAPWLEIVRRIAADDPRRLRGGIGAVLSDLARLAPALHELAGEAPPPEPLDPGSARLRLFETIAELLERAARDGPLLVVLDDFHWADRASQRLLQFLVRRLADAPLVLLVTHREDELPDDHVLLELRRLPGCTAIALPPLDLTETRRLVALELDEPVEPEVCDAIHERAGGNPFFVKELARSLAADGQLVAGARSGALSAGVRQVLRRRLAGVSGSCRDLLVLGAVLGRSFELGELARLAGLPAEQALALLDEARRAHLIRGSGGPLELSHALVRDALLADLPAAERARLHRRAGEAIETHHAGDLAPQLPRLAHHFTEGAAAGGVEKALDYARRAGERAAARLAWDEASLHFRRALAVQGLAPSIDPATRGALLLALGEALAASGETRAGREVLERAADLARELDRGDWLARAALAAGGMELSPEVGVPDVPLARWLEEALSRLPGDVGVLRIRLLVRLAIASFWCGDVPRSDELYARAVAEARRLGDPEGLCYGLYGQRWALVGSADVGARLAISTELLANAERSGRRDLELSGRSCRFLDLVELGRIAEADQELAVYARLATALRVPRYRWRTSLYRAMRAQIDGRFEEAEELARLAFAEGERIGAEDAASSFGALIAVLRREQERMDELEPLLKQLVERTPSVPGWRAALALAHLEMGRESEARDALASLLGDRADPLPSDRFWIVRLVVLAELAAGLGDGRRAGQLYDVLGPYAGRAVVVGAGVACWGAMDRILGLLATTAADWPAAERHFEAARGLELRMGARPWLGWTEHGVAEMLARRGASDDRARARSHLEHAAEIARSLGMPRLARRVAALEARLA